MNLILFKPDGRSLVNIRANPYKCVRSLVSIYTFTSVEASESDSDDAYSAQIDNYDQICYILTGQGTTSGASAGCIRSIDNE
jgi:hypothetical protein